MKSIRILIPNAALILLVAMLITPQPASAQFYSVLHTFTSGGDGQYPFSNVIMDAQGNLYGTSYGGGAYGNGTVFKLDPSGNETVLYSFSGRLDGDNPQTGLSQDVYGNLYGTTYFGGINDWGVVFKLDPSGVETVLHAFTGQSDGGYPTDGLIQDSQGNLYGTTSAGFDSEGGYGVAFELTPSGSETVLHVFTGFGQDGDGTAPLAGMVRDAQGNLYGTTSYGGGPDGYGIVFKLDPMGNETLLYVFPSDDTGNIGPEGGVPVAGLIQDAQGNLYGTTYYGGYSDEDDFTYGVVFKLDPSGKETVLHAFTGGEDGGNTPSGLVMDSQDNLYGTCPFGGQHHWGDIYKIDSMGNYSILYSFHGRKDGGAPVAGLMMDTQGFLYGTANAGGDHHGLKGSGVVFRLRTAPAVSSVTVKPKKVIGGTASNGTVFLTGPAGPDGAVVTLSSSSATLASVPATVTIPSGQTFANFTVTTYSTSMTTKVTISATYLGSTQKAALTVRK